MHYEAGSICALGDVPILYDSYLPNAITVEGCPGGPKHQGAKFVRVLSRDGIVITAVERSMMHIICQVVAVGNGR